MIKQFAKNFLHRALRRRHYELIPHWELPDWQRYPPDLTPRYNTSVPLPEDARNYLQESNPRLKSLRERYGAVSKAVTTPLLWTEGHVRPEDIAYFRGDNAYVWQQRGQNRNIVSYALSTYYIKSMDRLRLLETLTEDELFGNFVFEIDHKIVSRDLLDSILEIYFLEKCLGIAGTKEATVLDVGAGYGRLAHRVLTALPFVQTYLCTDAVPVSTFITCGFEGSNRERRSFPSTSWTRN